MIKNKEYVVKPQLCLKCGYATDRASSIGGLKPRGPKPGDVTVCIQCTHIMLFNPDLTLRDPTTEELRDILEDPRIVAVVNTIKEASSRRPPKPDPRPM